MLVIIGPSASGKSSVARELHRRRVLRVHPTWTTRPRRDDERVGCLEHRFVSDAAFDRLYAQGFFLETVAWVGGTHRYGLPPVADPPDGLVDAVILRAPFVEAFARRHGGDQLVYQIEDTVERARHRLALRGCPTGELAARLTSHQRERVAEATAVGVLVPRPALCLHRRISRPTQEGCRWSTLWRASRAIWMRAARSALL